MKIETKPMVRQDGSRRKDFLVDGQHVGFISAARGQQFHADPRLLQDIGSCLLVLSTSAHGSVTTVLRELRKKYGVPK